LSPGIMMSYLVLMIVKVFENCKVKEKVHILRSRPRSISTGQLHTSLYFHTRPIYHVVFMGSYFLNGMGEEKQNILKIRSLNGTQELKWKDREIYLQFDVEYTHKTEGVIKQRLHFIGKRIWIETYKWNGAIIEG